MLGKHLFRLTEKKNKFSMFKASVKGCREMSEKLRTYQEHFTLNFGKSYGHLGVKFLLLVLIKKECREGLLLNGKAMK